MCYGKASFPKSTGLFIIYRMKNDKEKDSQKQPYQKPWLRIIELAAEEVMAAGCKTASTTSTGVNGLPCASGACVNVGSS